MAGKDEVMPSVVKGEERISFRWGIPWLDSDWLQVPCLFFRHYGALGVSRPEFLMVLHLASYKHESPGGAARPSVGRIAAEMGLKKRQVQNLRRSLEGKGYLEVTSRLGKASEYSFRGLAEALLEWDRGVQSSAPRAIQCTPGVQSSAPKQEEQQEQHGGGGDGSTMKLLVGVGMTEGQARRWAGVVDPEWVKAWVEYGQRPGAGIRNVAGFLVSKFRSGEKPPERAGPDGEGRKYLRGPYGHLIEH